MTLSPEPLGFVALNLLRQDFAGPAGRSGAAPPAVCSVGPNAISTNQFDTNKSTDLDLVWSLQVHYTGIGFATLRVIDRAVSPVSLYSESKTMLLMCFRSMRIPRQRTAWTVGSGNC